MEGADNITGWIRDWQKGDATARDRVFSRLYGDLKRLASTVLHSESGHDTLQPTALLNDALMKLLQASPPKAEDRGHFSRIVARAMRQILIDHARSRLTEAKRMGELQHAMDEQPFEDAAELARLLEVDSALDELERHDPRLAQVVLYRYFAGYSPQETADLLDVHVRTVNRDWHKARAWLMLALDQSAVQSG